MSMWGNRLPAKIAGAIAGLGLMTAAVYSAFFVDWQTPVPPEPQLVRPLKTMVITSPFGAAGRKYPGKVSAHEEVQLAFQVSGQLIGFPVKNGLEVEKGELLGRLDRRDYENALAIRQAALEAAETDYRRMEDLWTRELAAKTEYANAKATYDAALAEVRIAQKALDDTDLHAPFAGVVADTYVDNFQNIDAAQPVLSLQDIEHVNIVVNVPEERVIRVVRGVDPPRDPEERAKLESSLYRLTATFEYLPGRAFDVEIKELTSKADSATQTYEATLVHADANRCHHPSGDDGHNPRIPAGTGSDPAQRLCRSPQRGADRRRRRLLRVAGRGCGRSHGDGASHPCAGR